MRNTSASGPSDPRIASDARRLRELLVEIARRRSLRDPVASMCEEAQLTPHQIHAVMWLGQDGPLTMGELARRVGITEKTITGLVDRLEQQGYLGRERAQDDRRVVRARLTGKGAEVFRDLDAHIQEKLTRLLGLLDPADRKALQRLLEKLARRLSEEATSEVKKP